MRPRDVQSLWVKHRPWYWAKDRRQPSRQDARREAVWAELSESLSLPELELVKHAYEAASTTAAALPPEVSVFHYCGWCHRGASEVEAIDHHEDCPEVRGD